jgi:hypothetical protein
MDNSVIENASDTNQAPVDAVPSERLFKQSELNEIVGRVRQEAQETARRQLQQQQAPQQPPPAQNQATKSLSEDDVKRLTSQELERQREAWIKETQERTDAQTAERIVAAYKEKISPGKEKYQDFEAVTGNLDMRYYPNVVQLLAEHVDNSHDVLYDLAQHRTKLSQIEQLCGHNPQDAIYEIKRLSDSIKANESSASSKHVKAPLSQQRPSNTGTDSGATLSVRDYKARYKV